MQDSSPEVHPAHKVQVVEVCAALEDLEDGLVEDRDRAGDTGNKKRLPTEYRGNKGRHERSEQHFLYTIEAGLLNEVERESESGQDIRKERKLRSAVALCSGSSCRRCERRILLAS